MSFSSEVSALFPNAYWHGESGIHVSVCGGGSTGMGKENRALILYALAEQKVGEAIWDFLQHRFSSMEWLLEKHTFVKLFMVDIDLQLQGKPTSVGTDRIVNKQTGNVFHRIAIQSPFIGGIRFWAESGWGSGYDIGFRFRIVKAQGAEEEENVREEFRRRAETIELEYNVVYDTIMEINEPPQEVDTITNAIMNSIKEEE